MPITWRWLVVRLVSTWEVMMTSSNGDIFHVTGPLCGEFTGHRWIPGTKASDAELWCFLLSDLRRNKRLSKQSWRLWFETPSRPLWRHCNVEYRRFDIVYRRNNRLKQWLRLNDTHTRFQFTRSFSWSSLLFPLLLSLHYYNNCNIVIIIVSLSLSLLLTWSCGFMPAYIFVLVNTIQGIA